MKASDSYYWNSIGRSYASAWDYNGRKFVSDNETEFIKTSLTNYFAKKKTPVKALDLGFGGGRILSTLEKINTINTIYGVDFSEEMVLYCKKKFKNSRKIKRLIHSDISKKLPFPTNSFDIVTSIRAIKYNKNWKEILKECHRVLRKNGLFIFEMPNINSVNRLSEIEVNIYKTTVADLSKTLKKNGFDIIVVKGGPIFPGILYDRINGPLLTPAIGGEKIFKMIFGETFLSRFIYITCRKQ